MATKKAAATSNFDQAFDLIIGVEGGYVNDLKDPGGETKHGISKRAYPQVDIKNLTLEQAKEIYKRDYWLACACDTMAWPLALLVFDCAVNQGKSVAVRLLQGAMGLGADGVIGPKTKEAMSKADNDTAVRFMADRALRYVGTANFDRYGKGWLRRLFHISFTV